MELYIDVEENSPSEIYSSQQTSQGMDTIFC